jgi:hypothetical protein
MNPSLPEDPHERRRIRNRLIVLAAAADRAAPSVAVSVTCACRLSDGTSTSAD